MSASDVEHGFGWGPQTFLEEDLLIPAGTNWGSSPQTIGQFSVPGDALALCGVLLELEDAEPLAASSLWFQIDALDVGTFVSTGLSGAAPDQKWISDLVLFNTGTFHLSDQNAALPSSLTAQVNFWTSGGALADDVRVVRARATFLVI